MTEMHKTTKVGKFYKEVIWARSTRTDIDKEMPTRHKRLRIIYRR